MNAHRAVSGAVALGALGLVLESLAFPSSAWSAAALRAGVLVLVPAVVYFAAGGPGVLRVGGAMFRRTMLTYLSYRAQLVAILAWTTLTVVILVGAGSSVLRLLIPSLAGLGPDESFPARFVALLLLGFTTWPVFWKSWEVTTLGVRTEQWEGTFEPILPMPHGVRSLPFGYLLARVPYTIFFQMAVLVALAFALPEGALRLDTPAAALDFAAVMVLAVGCMWGLGLLFGGLAILYKRLGPVDLVVRTAFLFLAGVFVPIALFPPWAQAVARLLPMTYAYELLQGVALDGHALVDLPRALLAMLGFTLASILAGNLLYRHYAEKARRDGVIQGY